MARDLQPCGTPAAYQRHLRRGEEPCDPCLTAANAYKASNARDVGTQRARQRALSRLSHLHPAHYAVLLAEELDKEDAR